MDITGRAFRGASVRCACVVLILAMALVGCGGSPHFVENSVGSSAPTATPASSAVTSGQQTSAAVSNPPSGNVMAANTTVNLTLVSGGSAANRQANPGR